MPGKGKAVTSGRELCDQVVEVAQSLGLDVRTEVRVARRLWGAIREIDVIVSDHATKRSLGIECKYQGGSGSAEEKIPATVQDIAAWPIPGIVVFEGDGFSKNMRAYLYSTGKAVELGDLRDWLMLFFATAP
jgi:hypothetical protein